MAFNFGPAYADETTVFGAERPGKPGSSVTAEEVQDWIQFMQAEGIARVVCLLTEGQLGCYRGDLLEEYRAAFGAANVLSAPIKDFELSSPEDLKLILGFLKESDARRQKVVVHCSGGLGRTGHVLAAWLASARGLAPRDAIQAVERAQPPRYPMEAARASNATEEQLVALLRAVSPAAD